MVVSEEKKKEYMRAYQKANKEKIKEYQRAYRAANKEKLKAKKFKNEKNP